MPPSASSRSSRSQWPVCRTPDAPAHPPPPVARLVGVGGLAVHLAVELEHRVAPEDEGRGGQVGGHRLALGAGQQQGHVGGFEGAEPLGGLGDRGVLVDVADDDASAPRRPPAGWRGGRGRRWRGRGGRSRRRHRAIVCVGSPGWAVGPPRSGSAHRARWADPDHGEPSPSLWMTRAAEPGAFGMLAPWTNGCSWVTATASPARPTSRERVCDPSEIAALVAAHRLTPLVRGWFSVRAPTTPEERHVADHPSPAPSAARAGGGRPSQRARRAGVADLPGGPEPGTPVAPDPGTDPAAGRVPRGPRRPGRRAAHRDGRARRGGGSARADERSPLGPRRR